MTNEEFQSYVANNFGRANVDKGLEKDSLIHLAIAGLGIGGESGEVQEHIKKHIRDGRPLHDSEEFALELGDVLHYLTYLASRTGFTLSQIMYMNKAKLDKRYGR